MHKMFSLKSALLVLSVFLSSVIHTEQRVIDLTHSLNPDVPVWPVSRSFDIEVVYNSTFGHGWLMVNNVEFNEHTSTHMDAPIHFSNRPGIWYASTIPIERLVGQLSLINLEEKAKSDRDYLVTAEDITSWEETYGTIPKGAIVLLNFGWSAKWDSYEEVFGTTLKNSSTIHFPGLGMDAARVLADRGIYGVGSDAPSLDYGQSTMFPVHYFLLNKNIYFLENVADMSNLPPGGKGVTLMVGSMKIDKGSGGPTRLIAMFDDQLFSSATTLQISLMPVVLVLVLSAIM